MILRKLIELPTRKFAYFQRKIDKNCYAIPSRTLTREKSLEFIVTLTCCADLGIERATEAAKRADNIDISDFHSD
jgi:hypothetical protein